MLTASLSDDRPEEIQDLIFREGGIRGQRNVGVDIYRGRMTSLSELTIDTLAGPSAPDGVKIRSDLLPPSTHGSNIRHLNPEAWDRLRIPIAERANRRCEICGAESVRDGRVVRPDCHEKWNFQFRGETPVQHLDRLIALCVGCHQVQHCGLAIVNGEQEQVIRRLQMLNNWSRQEALDDLKRSERRGRALDRYAWDLDLTVLSGRLVVPGFEGLYFTASDRQRLGKRRFPRQRPR